MRELCFEDVPDPDVRFRGSTGRDSVWESRRKNLPDEVREGVVYRNAGVRLRIATEIVGSDPDSRNRTREEGVRTSLKDSEHNTGEQGPESGEEKQ